MVTRSESWGKWFATFHTVSRRYSRENSSKVPEFQRWDEIHDGVLQGVELDPQDLAFMKDPNHYGIIHGDLNLSNFFYDSSERTLSVFDWDQTQQSWYLSDLSVPLLGVIMSAEAGTVIEGKPIEGGVDLQAFENQLVAGYESVTGVASVDRNHLKRMLDLRLAFYERFCRRAVKEGNIPPDMEPFIVYIVSWFDKRNSSLEMK
jgi:Ser/Thr protein kinase RdoA (MazF antagonist)